MAEALTAIVGIVLAPIVDELDAETTLGGLDERQRRLALLQLGLFDQSQTKDLVKGERPVQVAGPGRHVYELHLVLRFGGLPAAV